MIRSMTGFATQKIPYQNGELTCEVRSLNSRYLEVYVKLPTVLRELEDSVKDIFRNNIQRGKITCTVSFSSPDPDLQALGVNEELVRSYARLLERVRRIADIDTPVRISDLMEFKDIFTMEEARTVDESLHQALFELVEMSIAQLNDTRAGEGENLTKDLIQRLSVIEKLAREIEMLGKNNARAEFEKLQQRVFSLVDESKIDRNRLEMELALISDRVDISEEIVRLGSHIQLFRDTLQEGSPIGKKLNFILQEMHREANTIASKNTIIDISHRIVSVKEEIERIREQVQNIE